jgi:hypothetical protein
MNIFTVLKEEEEASKQIIRWSDEDSNQSLFHWTSPVLPLPYGH